ncbi:SDR family NAD(P)-dependent oxidoreductase [Vreelandella nanhaiensis]|uniref:SDR family NAD(P)-dependent oxidoreductase n=1 Tax=Vreelandella nanhaiensis TaxID=1258546 RepID=A0A3S0Y3S9_9GAMM|nr:SDR family NAD(P)-dependent oxidoreductase [Halomonas nanhaiensis]
MQMLLNEINLWCTCALRQFITQGRGTLINVSSVTSEVPAALQNTYAATKEGRNVDGGIRERKKQEDS